MTLHSLSWLMICEETLKCSGLLPSQSAREREKPAIISLLQKGDVRPILLEHLTQGHRLSVAALGLECMREDTSLTF